MDPVREHVLKLLSGGQAYETFDSIVGEFGPSERGIVPNGAEHSAWQIIEHMERALRDILDFTQNERGAYREKDWPADYWPESPLPDPDGWDRTLRSYRADLAEMEALVRNESLDLYKTFPWGNGQTLLREALLAADHAAYHLGQLVQLKRWIASAR